MNIQFDSVSSHEKYTPKQMKNYKKIFGIIDKDNSGFIDSVELKVLFKMCGKITIKWKNFEAFLFFIFDPYKIDINIFHFDC